MYALVIGGECLFKNYVESLTEKDRKQVVRLIMGIAKTGTKNLEKMKPIGNGIFELKTRNSIRFLSFWHKDRMLLLTHGFKKPKPKVLVAEIKKAEKYKQQFLLDEKGKRNKETSME